MLQDIFVVNYITDNFCSLHCMCPSKFCADDTHHEFEFTTAEHLVYIRNLRDSAGTGETGIHKSLGDRVKNY